jgi:hypothetical protein
MRAREYSDAVALLGRHKHISEEFLGLLREIERFRKLCDEAAAELDRVVSQTGASAASRSSDTSANAMVSERDALTKDLDEARSRSSRAFLEVTEDVPSGMPYPDSTERIERPASARQQAFEKYQQAPKTGRAHRSHG